MNITLDPTTLFLGLLIGGAGFVLFVYGKKQERWPQLVAGLVLMVYPYFVDGALASLGIAVAIGVGLWLAVRAGY